MILQFYDIFLIAFCYVFINNNGYHLWNADFFENNQYDFYTWYNVCKFVLFG